MRPQLRALPASLATATRAASPVMRRLPSASRTFTSLPLLRPTLFAGSSLPTTACRLPPTVITASPTTPAAILLPSTGIAQPDFSTPSAVSRQPALAGLGIQLRFKRATMERTSRKKRRRKIGFLSRNRTKAGRKIMIRKQIKGRKRMALC